MALEKTLVETTWKCDVCDKEQISGNYAVPNHWHEIVIADKGDRNTEKVDWRCYWSGVVCSECYQNGNPYAVLSIPETAKPLIKKIFALFKK